MVNATGKGGEGRAIEGRGSNHTAFGFTRTDLARNNGWDSDEEREGYIERYIHI